MFFRSNYFKSELYSEKTFYRKFLKDLERSKNEIIIESPYITTARMDLLLPVFQRLLNNKIKIHFITRDPSEHETENYKYQSTNEILKCNELGINTVLLSGYHHRKLAIIDRRILWEGSLNILSQTNSLEFMRRIESSVLTQELMKFVGISKLI